MCKVIFICSNDAEVFNIEAGVVFREIVSNFQWEATKGACGDA